jgi:hypothetical protein
MVAPNCYHRAVRTIVSINCSAIMGISSAFFCYATTKSGQKLTCIYNFIIQQISSYSRFSFPGMLDRFPKKFGLTHIFYFVLNPGKFSAWLLLPAKR